MRVGQLEVKKLVTDIKFSGIFEDDLLFKAIQYNVAKEVLDADTLKDIRFVPRGLSTFFDFKHFDLSVLQEDGSEDSLTIPGNRLQRIKRDKVCQSTDESCLSAIMSEPLPLHGIHYWEFKVQGREIQKSEHSSGDEDKELKEPKYRPVKPRQLFVGLCQVNDNHSLEDTHLIQSSVMLNVLDSNFWVNG